MGASFSEKTLKLLSRIPRGRVTTYGAIARQLKKPGAARAVGNACNANPYAPRVPCHRVVASDGRIGGYAKGTRKKIELLEKEGIRVQNGKIVDFEEKMWRFE
jgi:methylated-DNA-[protein]-cysteine S-methyltransferase